MLHINLTTQNLQNVYNFVKNNNLCCYIFILTICIQLHIYCQLLMTLYQYLENIYTRFALNSEALASEFKANLDQMFF